MTSVALQPQAGWLARLGLMGLTALEAPLLAALATEQPLLLIGVHGTAKSLLLTRVAEALGLTCRHYNASLLNFDDLVGFPVPGTNGCLEYLKTPAAIWGAGAVIFDEISRCRPDVQNKLFPIIHERKVQGLPLADLRYRWAAMNPPSTLEEDNGYAGSEPLDRALADRFTFVVQMPAWATFTRQEQLSVIQATDTTIGPADGAHLQQLLQQVKAVSPVINAELGDAVADYVHTLLPLLAQADLDLSPRRAGLLYQSVLAVYSAALAIDPNALFADTALQALHSCLPQRAEGIPVAEIKVLAAHREAIRTITLKTDDPIRQILATTDPLERLRLAMATRKLAKSEFSRIAADSLAQMPIGTREAAVVHLFETGMVGRLNAAVASQLGETYRDIVTPANFSETLHASDSRYRTWGRVKDLLARLDPDDPRAHLQANAVAALFAARQLQTPEDAERAFNAYSCADAKLGHARPHHEKPESAAPAHKEPRHI